MAANLTDQVRNIAQVTTAVARGDLTQKITVDAQGEIAELKDTINTMVDQLSSFADEVTRVAREVGTEGMLGGQAEVKGVSGTWRDLTENVNQLAGNLTSQVRNIAQVDHRGGQRRPVAEDHRRRAGRDPRAQATRSTRWSTSCRRSPTRSRAWRARWAPRASSAARPRSRACRGTWRGLTENVNQLAAQPDRRRCARWPTSSTAVTQGDLTRQITVEASGEVAELKDRVNQMIANLRDTTQQNAEQDWLKTNLARISGLMQGQRDLQTVSRMLMCEISPLVNAQHGAFFMVDDEDDGRRRCGWSPPTATSSARTVSNEFRFGEGLPGQAALEMKSDPRHQRARRTTSRSRPGSARPRRSTSWCCRSSSRSRCSRVIELASLNPFGEVHLTFLDQLSETIGVVLSTIIANKRTEDLLEEQRRLAQELQSQSEELQSQQDELKRSNTELEEQAKSLRASEELLQTQQEELRQTNEELQEKAALLAQQNRDIEVKNAEIERARAGARGARRAARAVLAYKSEFLANMSHELRTPLNSLLILSKLLADNPSGNLDDQQVEFARTINPAGTDLLDADLRHPRPVQGRGGQDGGPPGAAARSARCSRGLERAFRPVAEREGARVRRRGRRRRARRASSPTSSASAQVLRNLLSNALKFTERGQRRG